MNTRDNKPLISVVMSVYNEEKYIRESLESILNQTVGDFEIVIFDDCSTDRTAEIIHEIAREDAQNLSDEGVAESQDESDVSGQLYGSRIRLFVNDTNNGLTVNLNRGLKLARGKYIARMDGDDISLPERFEKQIEYLEKHPDTYLVSCQTETFGAENMVWRMEATPEVLRVMMFVRPVLAHPGFMMRSELINEGLLYDESYRSAQDYNLAARVAAVHNIGVVSPVLLRYRAHASQVSSKSGGKQFANADRVREMLLSDIGILFSEEDIMWFHKLVREDRDVTPEAFAQVDRLIGNIVMASAKSQIYDAETVDRILHELLFQWAIRTHKLSAIRKVYFMSGKTGKKVFFGVLRNVIIHKQNYA